MSHVTQCLPLSWACWPSWRMDTHGTVFPIVRGPVPVLQEDVSCQQLLPACAEDWGEEMGFVSMVEQCLSMGARQRVR